MKKHGTSLWRMGEYVLSFFANLSLPNVMYYFYSFFLRIYRINDEWINRELMNTQ